IAKSASCSPLRIARTSPGSTSRWAQRALPPTSKRTKRRSSTGKSVSRACSSMLPGASGSGLAKTTSAESTRSVPAHAGAARTSARMAALLLAHPDAVQPRRVLVRDLPPLGRGDVREHVADDLARVRPVAAVMRVVRRPHDVLDPDGVAVLHAVVVDDEGE